MTQAPKRTIRKFNPGVFQSDQDIIEQFVVRKLELDTVLEILRENVGSPSCQHTLVVGPRGRGKTMLLARVAAELRTDPQLRQTLLPVRFMEESVEVFDIGDFWLEALLYLAKECAEQDPGLSGEIEKTHADLARRPSMDDVAGNARAALLDAADRLGRRLVIMMENLQSLCEETDEDFGWQLRHSLQSDPEIMLLASATSHFEALDDAEAPFFELFRILQLRALSTAECQDLWQAITGERREARQMRPLEILTGGSPRLLVIVGEFARHRTMSKLLEELVGLVDDHSEYFRGNLNSLPRTERRVYAALCDLWRPSTTREVADRARSGVRKTSALLGRLTGRGAVTADGNGRSRLYSVAEPLHCIYYKLRRWRDEAAVVRGLIRFMVAFYGPDETAKILGSVLAEEGLQEAFRSAREDLDPELAEIPAGSAVDTYRELGDLHRGLSAQDWQINVAGELLNIGVRLSKSGQAERSIEYNDELIRRFGSTQVPEVQVLVVQAFFNKATARQNAGDNKAAVAGLNEVVKRFGGSNEPEIQECVAAAMLNRGFLQGLLGEREAAIATYDEAIGRFGGSRMWPHRRCVARALLNKGSKLADLDSPESMEAAIAIWDDLIERFGRDHDPDTQLEVAGAFIKKASVEMAMGRNEAAVAACDEVVLRCRNTDRPNLRRGIAMALELKVMSLNRLGRGGEALAACDVLVRDFGSISGRSGIPVKWRAMGGQIHALVLEGDESAAAHVFRKMCDDLDVADREMSGKIIWDTIDLIAAGAAPGIFADALADAAGDCEPLVPLMAVLQRLAGRPARVPEELEKVVADVVRTIEERRE